MAIRCCASRRPSYEVAVGPPHLQFNNTNRLVSSPAWDIGLQKTGYISEAGRCLVIRAQVSGRKIIMVFLTRRASLVGWATPSACATGSSLWGTPAA